MKNLQAYIDRKIKKIQKKKKPKLLVPPELPSEFDNILSSIGLFELLKQYQFQGVLDIGSGAGKHAAIFEKNEKDVTRFDFGKSRAFGEDQLDKTIIGDFIEHDFTEQYDCVWASHVLEHTIYTHEFLAKISQVCKEGGVIAITVPPAKPNLVGGHVTLWTPALLLYRLVLAGVDCSSAQCLRYGYNISILVENKKNNLDLGSLAWDFNDVERIKPFLPDDIYPDVNGDYVGKVYKGSTIRFR